MVKQVVEFALISCFTNIHSHVTPDSLISFVPHSPPGCCVEVGSASVWMNLPQSMMLPP